MRTKLHILLVLCVCLLARLPLAAAQNFPTLYPKGALLGILPFVTTGDTPSPALQQQLKTSFERLLLSEGYRLVDDAILLAFLKEKAWDPYGLRSKEQLQEIVRSLQLQGVLQLQFKEIQTVTTQAGKESISSKQRPGTYLELLCVIRAVNANASLQAFPLSASLYFPLEKSAPSPKIDSSDLIQNFFHPLFQEANLQPLE